MCHPIFILLAIVSIISSSPAPALNYNTFPLTGEDNLFGGYNDVLPRPNESDSDNESNSDELVNSGNDDRSGNDSDDVNEHGTKSFLDSLDSENDSDHDSEAIQLTDVELETLDIELSKLSDILPPAGVPFVFLFECIAPKDVSSVEGTYFFARMITHPKLNGSICYLKPVPLHERNQARNRENRERNRDQETKTNDHSITFDLIESELLSRPKRQVTTPKPSSARAKQQTSARKQRRKIPLPKALSMIDQYGMTECAARAACELMCTPGNFGRTGRTLHRMMTTLYTKPSIPGVPPPVIRYYRTAVNHGNNFKKGNRCRECYKQYPKCEAETRVMLRMSSAIEIVY